MSDNIKRSLKVPVNTFTGMLSGLIASGVTFEAVEVDGMILITFTGGY